MSRMTVANDSYGTNAVLCGTLHSLPTHTNDWLAPRRRRRRRRRRWLLNFGAINLDAEFCGMRTNCRKVNTKSAKQKKNQRLKKLWSLTESQLCFPQSISGGASETIFENGPQKSQQFINGIPEFELKMRHFKYDFGLLKKLESEMEFPFKVDWEYRSEEIKVCGGLGKKEIFKQERFDYHYYSIYLYICIIYI